MNLGEMLRPELAALCPGSLEELDVLKSLAERLRAASVPLDFTEIVSAASKRELSGTLPLGKGVALHHLRTEKVQDLSVSIAVCDQPIRDLAAADGTGVRVLLLLLIPRKHTDLYLRVLAALVEALGRSEVMDRLLAAGTPEDVVRAFDANGGDPENGTIQALFSGEGIPTPRLAQALSSLPPAELADLMEDLSPEQRAHCLGSVPPQRGAEIARAMRLPPLTSTLRRMRAEPAARILGQLPSSRSADVLQRMKGESQREILKHMRQQDRGDVQTILKYPPHTAGGIMTPTVLSAAQDTTVEQALQAVRTFPDRRQADLYVVTPEKRLVGRCRIHDLIGADPARKVSELMQAAPPSVEPERDQEELRRTIALSDLQSLPVVGTDGALLGVVLQDHLLEVVEHEADEDLQQIVGMKMVDPLHTPLGARLRMRMPWLLLTLGGELFIALVIAKVFKSTLERAVILSAFIPAIMATGGNVGLQATAMVIRGLGMGTLKRRHTLRIMLGELKVGFLLGLSCGAIAAVSAWLINWNEAEVMKVSLSVLLAMVSATLATSFSGTLAPLLLHRWKMDPATACGPFVTMFNDIFGSLVYLFIAMMLEFRHPAG